MWSLNFAFTIIPEYLHLTLWSSMKEGPTHVAQDPLLPLVYKCWCSDGVVLESK